MDKISRLELEKLLEQVSNGDDAAFSHLCRIYEGLVVRSVNSFAEGLDMAFEDVRQEALLALLRAAKSFDGEQKGVSFGLYAKICIRNALISLRRKQKSRKRREGKPSQDGAGSFSGQVGRLLLEESSERIGKLLTPLERRILEMCLSGESYAEIAEELGISQKKVDNTLYRLRKKLKKAQIV